MDWKWKVRKMFLKLGYDVQKTGVQKTVVRGKYTRSPHWDYLTYSPWFENWFQEIYTRIRGQTIDKEDKCYIIHRFCKQCLHIEGDFAECGVYKGGTAFLIAYTLVNESIEDKRLHLFDTFTGMPAIAEEEPTGFKEGDFGDTSLDAVNDYLRPFPLVVFHPGVIPETFEEVEDRRFAFVHMDVDLYRTTTDCCNFFYDRMVSGGVIVFNDYGLFYFQNSEKRAVDEFFNDKPETPISLPTGQCIVIKL